MQQGELMLRNPMWDEGYWIAVLAVAAAAWTLMEKSSTQEGLALLTCTILAAAAVLRLTVLRSRHIRRVPWTLDGEKLTVGTQVLPLEDIERVELKEGTFVRGSIYLVIRGRTRLRLAALVRGRERQQSIQTIRELGWALKQAIDRPAGAAE